MTHSVQRRRFLIGGAAALASASVGFAWFRGALGPEQWIEHVVRSNLPGVQFDETALGQFIAAMSQHDWFAPSSHRLAIAVDRTVPWVAARVPKVRDGLEKLERRVLTEFLIGSNFFRVPNPRTETIVYYGPAIACGNPFVSLS